jgi:hypothetical protein
MKDGIKTRESIEHAGTFIRLTTTAEPSHPYSALREVVGGTVHGQWVISDKLERHVVSAWPAEERQAKLEAYFAQIRRVHAIEIEELLSPI